MRVCAVNGTNVACGSRAISRPRRLNFSLASTTMLRPSGVSSASEASCAASASRPAVHAGRGQEVGRLRLPSVIVPVLSSSSTSMSPAASTARPLIARTLRLQQAIDAGDADGAEQPADGGRNQADEQRDRAPVIGERHAGVDAERLQRDEHEQEDERERGEQDGERDFVRRLLALRAFDQGDHAVEKGLARFDRDADATRR